MAEFIRRRRAERGLPQENRLLVQNTQYETPFQWMMPIWPYAYATNTFHEWLEYFYEFVRGSRLATTSELDVCEDPVSSFFES